MAAFINTNTASLNAQRNLTTSQSSLTTSLQRLSSGLRINSAKDDAAGLAISERFTTQIRGISQAARNANDGISLAQTAEGTLGEIGNNLQRMRELAVQSRNSTNSAEDRIALDTEVQQLKAEIGRVAGQANFNGTKLLDGSATNMTFQVGANQGETIGISNIANANVDKLGTWKTPDTAVATASAVPTGVAGAAATSGTGTIGVAGVTAPATTSGTGTIGVAGVKAPASGAEIAASTISLDGGATTINIGATTTGTAGSPADAQAEYLSNVAAAINGAGASAGGVTATYNATAKTITFANSGATAKSLTGTAMTGTTAVTASSADIAASTISLDGGATTINIGAATGGTAADAKADYLSKVATAINGAGAAAGGVSATYDAPNKTITFANPGTTAKSLTGTAMTGTTTVAAGTAAGATTFSAIAAGELQINGKDVTVGTATSGANRVNDLVAAINSQVTDVVASKDTSGKLVLTSTSAIDVKGSKASAADSGLAVATASVTASTSPASGFANENVTTTANADRMILAMDAALKSVNSSRAGLGAVQNRFSSVIANLQTTSENLSASRSRIQDTDFAAETASLTRGQILQQAGTAMLAQANSLPNGVLSLLRG